MGTSSVEHAQANLNQAKESLKIAKEQMTKAKANGDFKNSAKQFSCGGTYGNIYQHNVYRAQKRVKECQEALARAKKSR